jgi:hypothetical protein
MGMILSCSHSRRFTDLHSLLVVNCMAGKTSKMRFRSAEDESREDRIVRVVSGKRKRYRGSVVVKDPDSMIFALRAHSALDDFSQYKLVRTMIFDLSSVEAHSSGAIRFVPMATPITDIVFENRQLRGPHRMDRSILIKIARIKSSPGSPGSQRFELDPTLLDGFSHDLPRTNSLLLERKKGDAYRLARTRRMSGTDTWSTATVSQRPGYEPDMFGLSPGR